MIFEQIKQFIKNGDVIPKPEAKSDFIIKGFGIRRGEEALVFYVPNHRNPERPNEKGINRSEWEKAYEQLLKSGEFSRKWFDTNISGCSKEGPCNFTTIGGIFEKLGLAVYKRGAYIKK